MEVALYMPEIPPNTGNISRLCVCTGTRLHIIGKPAFSMDEAAVRRAGLDYWDRLDLHMHEDWDAFRDDYVKPGGRRVLLLSKFASRSYARHEFQEKDVVVFGRESSGLPDEIKDEVAADGAEHLLRIPIKTDCRSLNLSNSVAIVLFEALRQGDFAGLDQVFQSP